MRDTELKKLRNLDLYKCYRKGLEEGRFRNVSHAAEYVMSCPAPRFYVSAREVNLCIGKILSGVSLISVNEQSRRRIWVLYDRLMEYLSAYPDSSRPREHIIEDLVDEPAPEFYLSWESARKILQKEIKKRRSKWLDT